MSHLLLILAAPSQVFAFTVKTMHLPVLKFKSHDFLSPASSHPKIKKRKIYSFTFKSEHWLLKNDLKTEKNFNNKS